MAGSVIVTTEGRRRRGSESGEAPLLGYLCQVRVHLAHIHVVCACLQVPG
jgi:hypothetical protein